MTTITDYQLLMFHAYVMRKLSWWQDNISTADNDTDIEMIRKITNADFNDDNDDEADIKFRTMVMDMLELYIFKQKK